MHSANISSCAVFFPPSLSVLLWQNHLRPEWGTDVKKIKNKKNKKGNSQNVV